MKSFCQLPGLLSLLVLCACEPSKQDVAPAHSIFNLEVPAEIPASHKVPMLFQVLLPDSVVSYSASIERRGGYSISFPKASFEIDLKEDVSLAGLPADDDWILNANYIDKTFLRHRYSYDLFRDMSVLHEAPHCAYVELRLNGRYQGLYVLMEKLDKSSLDLRRADPTACIFKEPPLFIPELEGFQPQYTDNYYQQTYPDKRTDDRTAFIESVRNFLTSTPDSLFAERVGEWFDMPNIIDWHLLLLLSNNSDGLKKNFYLYKKDSTTPLRVAPWDYDHSYGRDGDNEMNFDRWIDCERSLLFQRLMAQPAYRKALRQRWYALNDQGIFKLASLLVRVDAYQSQLEQLVPANFAQWPANGPVYYDANDFSAELNLMKKYLGIRHEMLTTYFAEMSIGPAAPASE